MRATCVSLRVERPALPGPLCVSGCPALRCIWIVLSQDKNVQLVVLLPAQCLERGRNALV